MKCEISQFTLYRLGKNRSQRIRTTSHGEVGSFELRIHASSGNYFRAHFRPYCIHRRCYARHS